MNHIIRQQYFDIEVNGTESAGLAIQNRLSSLCSDSLMPAIEKILDHYAPLNQHLYFDRLEIDAGSLTLDNLESELAECVSSALQEKLRSYPLSETNNSALASDTVRRRTTQQSLYEAFIYFLKTGRLPWEFKLTSDQTFEQVLLDSWRKETKSASRNDLISTVHSVLKSSAARKRLVCQFSPAFWEELLLLLSPDGKNIMAEILATLSFGGSPSTNHFLWEKVFVEVVNGQPQSAKLLVSEALRNVSVAKPIKFASEEFSPKDALEGIYIDCAGLVLLHPFLPQFFKALGIVAEDTLLQPDRAVCLLHYLATGQVIAPEYELILPKILCNIPLEIPVESDVSLTTEEQEEATALLDATIRHWEALRNTSVDGLRGTFLVRPGKISLRDDGDWLLQVESKSYDILLDQLPWGIGMIKLAWMQQMLWVEWG